MKIVLFGATGNVGQRVAREAVRRGHQVVGVVRNPAASTAPDPAVSLAKGDATDAASVAAVVRGADAVVSAISPRPNAQGLPAPSLTAAARALNAGLTQAGVKRLIVVGGAGSLEVKPGVALVDTPEFPEPYRPEARAQRDALGVYRTEVKGLDWTYISPAVMIQPGQRTGKYRVGGDQILSDDKGQSVISFEDYAVALVDELERGQHVRKRITVAY